MERALYFFLFLGSGRYGVLKFEVSSFFSFSFFFCFIALLLYAGAIGYDFALLVLVIRVCSCFYDFASDLVFR